MTPADSSCLICRNVSGNTVLKVREMYFGTREVFDYLECRNCGCLQLLNPPRDLSPYYPDNYFTYNQKNEIKIKSLLNKYRDQAALGVKSVPGSILLKLLGEPVYITRLKSLGIGLNDSILDVGCGRGILLHKMRESGFKNVSGIDPFINETIIYRNGLEIQKKNFSEMEGRFDLIMFNHSFEHMENPSEIIERSFRLLEKNKFLLLRIPVADSFAFRRYRENWCSLDAPRHLFIHTRKSVGILAEKSGFKIKKINYDSRSWQLWGSEQYLKDIPLIDERSYYLNPSKSIFTRKDISDFEEITARLNRTGEGDQAEFYLQKIEICTGN